MIWMNTIVKLPIHQLLMIVYYMSGNTLFGCDYRNPSMKLVFHMDTGFLTTPGHHTEQSFFDRVKNFEELKCCNELERCWNEYPNIISSLGMEPGKDYSEMTEREHDLFYDLIFGTCAQPVQGDDINIIARRAIQCEERAKKAGLLHIRGPITTFNTCNGSVSFVLNLLLDSRLDAKEVRQALKLMFPHYNMEKLDVKFGYNHQAIYTFVVEENMSKEESIERWIKLVVYGQE